MEARIEARIAALEIERNKVVYAYNVAITELKKLLAPDDPVPAGLGSGSDGEEPTDRPGGDEEAQIVHHDRVAGLRLRDGRNRATS